MCMCETTEVVNPTVLDPFSGSATTGRVALQEGRDYIGCDLNPNYIQMAEARLRGDSAPQDPTDASDDCDITNWFKGSEGS